MSSLTMTMPNIVFSQSLSCLLLVNYNHWHYICKFCVTTIVFSPTSPVIRLPCLDFCAGLICTASKPNSAARCWGEAKWEKIWSLSGIFLDHSIQNSPSKDQDFFSLKDRGKLGLHHQCWTIGPLKIGDLTIWRGQFRVLDMESMWVYSIPQCWTKSHRTTGPETFENGLIQLSIPTFSV